LRRNLFFIYTPPIEDISRYTRIFLELIKSNKSNNIYILECKGKNDLNKCVSNYRGERQKCLKCKSGILYLKNELLNTKNIFFINYEKSIDELSKIKSKSELLNYSYEGINIGKGINSYLISTLHDHNYNFSKNTSLIESQLFSSVLTIQTLKFYLNLGIDEIYLFNGRVSHHNALLEFSRFYKIPFKVFEMVFNPNKYEISVNKALHDANEYKNKIQNNWLKSTLTESKKSKIGTEFFKKNRFHFEKKKNGIFKYLKNNFQNEKIELITIFNSSRSEYECVENWNSESFFKDDEDLISEICQKFKNDPKKHFILRSHPNLAYYKNTQNKNTKKLKRLKNLLVIDSKTNLSSYELINISSKVITFGSTIGVEASYLGKPVISIGDSAYKYLNVIYTPNNKDELFSFINMKLKAKPISGSLKYGYYILEFGTKFKFQKKIELKYNVLKYFILNIFYKSKSTLLNPNFSLIYLKRKILNWKN